MSTRKKALWAGLIGLTALSGVGQPLDAERRGALEQRRDLLAARLAEIEAELAGDVPEGTVRLFGAGQAAGDERGVPVLRDRRRDGRMIVDPDTREQLVAELEKNDPELAAFIREAMNRRGGGSLPVFGRLREMLELRDTDPEAFEARRAEVRAGLRVLRVSGALRDLIAADGAEEDIERITFELRTAVAEGFDAKRAVLRLEIDRGEQRAAEMRQRLQNADTNRSSLIDEHLNRLLERIRSAATRRGSTGG